jgi:hypothetical protein
MMFQLGWTDVRAILKDLYGGRRAATCFGIHVGSFVPYHGDPEPKPHGTKRKSQARTPPNQKKNPKSQRAIDRWERSFRVAARADKYAILRDHLRRLDLPDLPESLLEGTVCVVRACSRYSALDQQPDEQFERFLEMQRYDPSDATAARYAFTFDLHGKAFARVLAESKMQALDLADLYGNPWSDYKVVGYHRLWISRTDWSDLTRKELRQLAKEVTGDLRFDYSEDELAFWFDDCLDNTYLLVAVQDV